MSNDPRKNGPDYSEPFKDMRDSMNLMIGFSQCMSKPLEVWLHKTGTTGERYHGYQTMIGTGLMLCLLVFFPRDNPCPLFLVFGLTLFGLMMDRIKGIGYRKKNRVHSLYSGLPLLPGNELKVKGVWEPGLAMLIGIGLCFLSPPVGTWFIVSGFCLGLANGWQQDADSARIRAMRDAAIENQIYTERFRKEMEE